MEGGTTGEREDGTTARTSSDTECTGRVGESRVVLYMHTYIHNTKEQSKKERKNEGAPRRVHLRGMYFALLLWAGVSARPSLLETVCARRPDM